MDFIKDKYFTTGMIVALVGLYATSAFTYFNATVASASSVQALEAGKEQVQVQKILEVVNAENGETIFRPIRAGSVIVPGSTCVITGNNIGTENEFIKVPADCFLTGLETSDGD